MSARPSPGGAATAATAVQAYASPTSPTLQAGASSAKPISPGQGVGNTMSRSPTAAEAAAGDPEGSGRSSTPSSAMDNLASSEQDQLEGPTQEAADVGSASAAKVSEQGRQAAQAVADLPCRAATALQDQGSRVAAAVQAQGSRAASTAKEVGQAAAEKASATAQVGVVRQRARCVASQE